MDEPTVYKIQYRYLNGVEWFTLEAHTHKPSALYRLRCLRGGKVDVNGETVRVRLLRVGSEVVA